MVQVRFGRNRPRFSATEIENETKRHCRLGVVVLKDVPRIGNSATFPAPKTWTLKSISDARPHR